MKKLSLILVILLSACGGGHRVDTIPPVTTPPVPVLDAFYTLVLGMIADASDSTEPVATDALTATSPEDTEPVALN